MKKFNNKSGFTLIEIIVVLIIVGILAAIALPNLFSNVSKARSEEALASISTFRPTVEGCIVKAAGVSDQTACASTVIGNPVQSANFAYSLTPPANGQDTGYSVLATGTGALTAADTITITRGSTAWPYFGSVSCQGLGQLQGAC